MRRWGARALVVLGLLLLVGAGAVRWVLAPSLAVLPADTDTTRHYAGTAAIAVDASALDAGGTMPVVLKDVPVAIENRTRVRDTDGGNARILSSKKVDVNGEPMVSVEYPYAVDRTTMGHGSGFRDVVQQNGITFGWPIRTEQRDYTGWIQDTGGTVPLLYKGTERKAGVLAYVFEANMPTPQQITDAQALKALPRSMGKLAAVKLMPSLGLDPERSAQLKPVLLGLPDPIPFTYTLQVESKYWVEPDSGVVLDAQKHEVRTLGVTSGDKILPIMGALDMTFNATPETLQEAAADARESGDQVFLIFVTVPAVMAGVGAVLLLLGLAGLAVPRRRTRSDVPADQPTLAFVG